MKEFKRQEALFFLLFAIFIIGFIFIPQSQIFAANSNTPDTLGELENAGIEAYGEEPQTDISLVVGKIIKIVLELTGLILVILLIAGGVMWMTSGGNEGQIKKAKGLLLNAIIGLVIIILAYTITHFILTKFSSVTDTTNSPSSSMIFLFE